VPFETERLTHRELSSSYKSLESLVDMDALIDAYAKRSGGNETRNTSIPPTILT